MEHPKNFFGLPNEFSTRENSRAAIVPCPYEATVTYGKGTKNAPEAILKASQQVELFDDELWVEPHKIGIHTHADVHVDPVIGETVTPFQPLYEVVRALMNVLGVFGFVGGEHSLSVGAVRAFCEKYSDLSVLQISSHADLRSAYDGNPFSHASVGFQIYKILPKPQITAVGVRNISLEEVMWLENEQPSINIFCWNFHEIVNTLSDNVYLSIDAGGLDPSIMPSIGTPEPGGMTWPQLTGLMKILFVRKNVVGADLVEMAPISGIHAPDFLAARLLYKLIGYRFALDLGVVKRY